MKVPKKLNIDTNRFSDICARTNLKRRITGGRSLSFGSHAMKDVVTLNRDEPEKPCEAV